MNWYTVVVDISVSRSCYCRKDRGNRVSHRCRHQSECGMRLIADALSLHAPVNYVTAAMYIATNILRQLHKVLERPITACPQVCHIEMVCRSSQCQQVQRFWQCSYRGTNWWQWRSNVVIWMQPVAYSCTDVDFYSDVWMCLDVDIATLAKSLKSICNVSLYWHPQGQALQRQSWVTNWAQWQSNVAVWMQPVAYSCTDVDFDSDVWMCLDVDTTTLAKSLKSYCNDSLALWAIQKCDCRTKVKLYNGNHESPIEDSDDPMRRYGCSH